MSQIEPSKAEYLKGSVSCNEYVLRSRPKSVGRFLATFWRSLVAARYGTIKPIAESQETPIGIG